MHVGPGKEAFFDDHIPGVFRRECKGKEHLFPLQRSDMHIDQKLPYLPLDHRQDRIPEP
jgi:hypothetical protein